MEKSLIQHLSCKTGIPLLQLTEWIEDWEEKKDKDYKILSYGVGFPNAPILKVKRLSDNEVFTNGELTDEGKIKEFYIDIDNILWVRTEEKGGVLRIHEIKKIKERKPFITEDGKDRFNNDTIYGVALLATGKDLIRKQKLPFPFNSIGSNRKWFSTEEKAKEYALLNKPLLSVKETAEYLVKNYAYIQSPFIEMKLVDLAKTKI